MNDNSFDTASSGSRTMSPKFLQWSIAAATFSYVVVAFGFKGVPGVSRLALYSAAFLCLLIPLRSLSGIRLPLWIAPILLFYSYLALPALAYEGTSFDKLGAMIVVLVGTLSIGVALQNQFVSYKVVAYGAVVAAILNVVAVQLGIDTTPIGEIGRSSGLMGNPNSLTMSMAFAAFLVWIFPERFNVMVRFSAIFLGGYGVFVSGSRKGLILLAALFLVVGVDQVFKLGKVKMVVIVPFVLAGLIVFNGYLYTAAKNYGGNVVSVQRLQKGLSGKDRSYNDRAHLIEAGIKLWKESPLIGHGFSQFSRLSGYGSYAHNNYIEVAVSGGIIGLLLFYSIHVIILFKALKTQNPLRLRLIILLLTIGIIDMAFVSFYDKATMCMLVTLMAVSSFPTEFQ